MHEQVVNAEAEAETIGGAGKPGFRYSLENMRGLAILFVMLSHVGSFAELKGAGSYLVFLFHDATAWFVFISGYLFQRTEDARFRYGDYLRKKAKFVVLPYLILSCPVILAGLAKGWDRLHGLSAPAYVLWSLAVGGSFIVPLWFIPMIVVFFLLSPGFHRLGRSALPLQLCVLAATLGISLFTARPLHNLNPLLSFVHFSGFYVLGVVMAANSARVTPLAGGRSGWLLLALAAAGFLAALLAGGSALPAEESGFMEGLGRFDASMFGKLCLLVVVYVLFERFLDRPNKALGWLANISFGLFFLQGFAMLVFYALSRRLPMATPALSLMLELAVVLGGSVLAVVLVKRILGRRSRYVIGC